MVDLTWRSGQASVLCAADVCSGKREWVGVSMPSRRESSFACTP